MTDKRITDKEILAVLDTPYNRNWVLAPADDDYIRVGDVIDLAKRQRAEIKELNNIIDNLCDSHTPIVKRAEEYAREDVIKEFEKRLRKEIKLNTDCEGGIYYKTVYKIIANLAKEYEVKYGEEK